MSRSSLGDALSRAMLADRVVVLISPGRLSVVQG